MTISKVIRPPGLNSLALPSLGSQSLRAVDKGARLLATRLGAVLVFFTLWQYLTTSGALSTALIPSLDQIFGATWEALAKNDLSADIAVSLQRSTLAFVAAMAFSIPLGLFMGSFRKLEAVIDPLLQVFRQTSALALYPVFILLLGLGEASKVFVIFWAAAFPILLSTISGVQQTDKRLVEMARLFGASPLQVFRRVLLPASIPAIFVGLRLSATTSILMLVAAEMIGAHQGLGFRLINAQYNFQIPLMFGVIFMLAGLGLSVNYSLVYLQKHWCKWSSSQAK
ncbi:MAG: ABC transporter permease [Thiothrix sp.]|nr:MAG: ABC transporter permease [Thiothrix sp.]